MIRSYFIRAVQAIADPAGSADAPTAHHNTPCPPGTEKHAAAGKKCRRQLSYIAKIVQKTGNRIESYKNQKIV